MSAAAVPVATIVSVSAATLAVRVLGRFDFRQLFDGYRRDRQLTPNIGLDIG